MNTNMIILNEDEAVLIEGGNPLVLAGMAIGAYVGLLDKMEKNPQDYTWTMDWYYR